jgi:hypothetical protein
MGAEPTNGVIRLLNKFNLYPKYPAPHGSASLFERPQRTYWGRLVPKYTYRKWRMGNNAYIHMMQKQFANLERKKRIQAEVLDSLGQQ